jgi:hypothetical protein
MKKLTLLITVLFMVFTISYGQDLQIHGFISQGAIYSTEYNYIASNSKDFSFDFQEIGINFQTDVSDRLHLGMQLLARDVGVYGEGRVTIDWAYGDYYVNDAFQIAIGRVKNRLGFYTTIQDFDFLRTWAVLPSSIYDMGLRTVNSTVDGMQIHGNLGLNQAGDIDYAVTFGSMKLGKISDIGAYVGQLTNYPIQSGNLKYNFALNLIYNTPISGLRLNGTYSRIEDFIWDPINLSLDLSNLGLPVYDYTYQLANDIDWFYTGAQYTFNKFEITGEYNYGVRHMTYTIDGIPDPVLTSVGRVAVEKNDDKYHGAYLGLSYRAHEKLSLGGYYQYSIKNLDESKDDPSNKGHDMALSLAYYPNYNFVIKLEGHFVDGTAPLSVTLNDSFDADTWMYGVVKVSYNF